MVSVWVRTAPRGSSPVRPGPSASRSRRPAVPPPHVALDRSGTAGRGASEGHLGDLCLFMRRPFFADEDQFVCGSDDEGVTVSGPRGTRLVNCECDSGTALVPSLSLVLAGTRGRARPRCWLSSGQRTRILKNPLPPPSVPPCPCSVENELALLTAVTLCH